MAKIVDNFEDGDLSEYGGDTGFFAVNESDSYNGDYGLDLIDADSYRFISSTSGLNYYPQPGDTFRAYYNSYQYGDEHYVLFATQDETNNPDCYKIRCGIYNDQHAIEKVSGGATEVLASGGGPQEPGRWYHLEVQWETDGTITSTVVDQDGTIEDTLSVKDTEFTTGGIGWGHWTNGGASMDYYMLPLLYAPSGLTATLQ